MFSSDGGSARLVLEVAGMQEFGRGDQPVPLTFGNTDRIRAARVGLGSGNFQRRI